MSKTLIGSIVNKKWQDAAPEKTSRAAGLVSHLFIQRSTPNFLIAVTFKLLTFTSLFNKYWYN